jgi:Protein of unknown function (DUF3800)
MALSFPKLDIGLQVFIDDSGDHGIKIQSSSKGPVGNTWLIIGAVAVEQSNAGQIPRWCESIKSACGLTTKKPLHFVKLDRDQRKIATEMVSKLPIKCFVFCSNKENMRGYSNDLAAAKSKEKNYFYHSCVKYLFERVTDFGFKHSMHVHGKPKHLQTTIDKNEMVPFGRLRTYLDEECKKIRSGIQFHSRRSMKVEVFNFGAFKCDTDEQCPGLQLADIVSGAFFGATENSKYPDKFDTQPALALSPVMWNGWPDECRKFADNGVTLFPPYADHPPNFKERQIFESYGFWFPETPPT